MLLEYSGCFEYDLTSAAGCLQRSASVSTPGGTCYNKPCKVDNKVDSKADSKIGSTTPLRHSSERGSVPHLRF